MFNCLFILVKFPIHGCKNTYLFSKKLILFYQMPIHSCKTQ